MQTVEKCSVLIIDDEPIVLETIVDLLVSEGYQVAAAGSGQEGLRRFTEARQDVVVTDLRMPIMDGFAVIKAIKLLSPSTPVVALSGQAADGEAQRAGATASVAKPILEAEALIAAIEAGRNL